jgi:hypothetical protein
MTEVKRMVKVRSNTRERFGVIFKAIGFKRVWERRGVTFPIEYGIMEQLVWDAGFMKALESGKISIVDRKDAIDLGLISEEEKEKEEYILDDNKINYLLKVAPIVKFKEDLELMNDTQIETLFDVAVEEKLTDYSKCQELKKLTGKDVLKQVQLASDDEE